MNKLFTVLIGCLLFSNLTAQTLVADYNFNSLSPWTNVDGSSAGADNAWYTSNGELKISTNSGTSADNWLVSPVIDLSEHEEAWLQFEYFDNIAGSADYFQIVYSTDFNGTYSSSQVNAATWTALDIDFWEVSENGYLSSFQSIKAVDIKSIAGNEVYFALVYNTNGNTSGFHEFFIDNFKITADYYTAIADFWVGELLKTSLHELIDGHTSLEYTEAWNAYFTTDVREDNGQRYVWDMYTDNPSGNTINYIHGADQDLGFGGTAEGDAYNREHVFPKSWFGGSTSSGLGTDLHNLPPSDKRVNGYKSNYPLGHTDGDLYISTNGTKIGDCTDDGYSDKVFEPIDEYKGDFARMYFYFATRYEGWFDFNGDMPAPVYSGDYKVYPLWLETILLDWHLNDPVSQKEIDRNNAVFTFQGNRNPFVDHPEWVSKIWGDVEAPTEGKLIISQYIEANGGTQPKGIELWNPTPFDIDLSEDNLEVEIQSNANADWTSVFILDKGKVAAGQHLVLGSSEMSSLPLSCGFFHQVFFNFNGNDAIRIQVDGTITDVFGDPSTTDPGAAWTNNSVTTANSNIQLKPGILTGNVNGWTDPSERFETVSDDNSLTGFGETGETCFELMPVGLNYFTANPLAEKIQLNWQSAYESSNASFILERSSNGTDYTFLATIQGEVDTDAPENYSYTDANPYSGYNYYRLYQEDFSSNRLLLSAIYLDFEPTIDIEPIIDFQHHQFEIQFQGQGIKQGFIADFMGRKIQSYQWDATTSMAQIDISFLKEGAYLLWIEGSAYAFYKK